MTLHNDSWAYRINNFHLENHEVTLMELSSLLDAKEVRINEIKSVTHSNAYENGSDLEQMVISLLKVIEKLVN